MESGRVLCDLRVDVPASHAPRLLTLIHQALRLTSIPLSSIDLFAASQGPGSFTGLRIGIATLMGLGHALQREVVGIDSLEALALKAWSASVQVGALLDARKGEVFGALFHWQLQAPAALPQTLSCPRKHFVLKLLNRLCCSGQESRSIGVCGKDIWVIWRSSLLLGSVCRAASRWQRWRLIKRLSATAGRERRSVRSMCDPRKLKSIGPAGIPTSSNCCEEVNS